MTDNLICVAFCFWQGGEEEGEEKYLTSRSQRELASVARGPTSDKDA